MNQGRAKIFRHGRSQAVRLPKAFRLPGREARVRRDGDRIILEPIVANLQDWFAALDRFDDDDFMKQREQPSMPEDDIDLDRDLDR